MKHIIYLSFLFVIVSSNIVNNFILDYFKYKQTTSVVGFSCNDVKDDISLIRSFNKINVTVALSKLNNDCQIHRLAHTKYKKVGIFLDLRCHAIKSISSIFNEAADFRMYDDLYLWLVLGTSVTDVSNSLNDDAFGYSTDFVIAVPLNDTTAKDYALYDCYNIWKHRGTKLNITFMGFWSRNGEMSVVIKKTRFERRSDIDGLTLNVSFYNFGKKSSDKTLEDYLQDYTIITTDNVSKFGYIIISHLSDMFNFKMQCNTSPKWQPGNRVGPVVQSIFNNENDITGTPAIITPKRLNVIKYTFQSWPYRSCFIFRSPQPKTIKINGILGPLESTVWYTIVVFFILKVFVLTLVFRCESNKSTFMCYSDSFLSTVGAICQQGTDIKMNLAGTRIVFFFVMLFGYLLYNYYSAIIVSTRLNEPVFKLNDSLITLAKTDLKLFSTWIEYFELFIKRPDYETRTFYTTRWMKIPENEKWMEPIEALSLVKGGGYAYHAQPDVVYQYISRLFDKKEICELTEIHLQRSAFSDFGISLNSTIVEMLRVGLTKIAEVGLRKRQIIRWKTQKPPCLKSVLTVSSVNMYEFLPHLLVLAAGMGIALVIFIFEIKERWFFYNLIN